MIPSCGRLPSPGSALRLSPAIRSVPLNRNGHDFYKYKESRVVGYEAEANADPKRLQARQAALEEGKLSAEEFDRGCDATPKAWYKQLAADVDGCVEALGDLDRVGRERFGDSAPNFLRLQDALSEIQRAVRQLLTKKLELRARSTGGGGQCCLGPETPTATSSSAALPETAPGVSRTNVEATDRESAIANIIGAAR